MDFEVHDQQIELAFVELLAPSGSPGETETAFWSEDGFGDIMKVLLDMEPHGTMAHGGQLDR